MSDCRDWHPEEWEWIRMQEDEEKERQEQAIAAWRAAGADPEKWPFRPKENTNA